MLYARTWAIVVLASAALGQFPTPASQRTVARAYRALTDDGVRATAGLSNDAEVDFTDPSTLLAKILIPRAPGSQNLSNVQDVIRRRFLHEMSSPWAMVEDHFDAETPIGTIPMTNLIFTHDPEAERKLVLAAHIDSKYYPSAPGNGFVGATDSAAPVAIIVSVAQTLTPWLDAKREADKKAREHGDRTPRTTLSILILDGEEAFKDWTHTDSIYGARHLAQLWSEPLRTPSAVQGSQTALSQISTFLLLDLLGAPAPKIRSFFHQTGWLFDRLVEAEDKLGAAGLLHNGLSAKNWKASGTAGSSSFFEPRRTATASQWVGQIEDDHLPFLARGVPIVHLIPVPFPSVWHTLSDDASALDIDTIKAWSRIMRLMVAEYLALAPSTDRERSELVRHGRMSS